MKIQCAVLILNALDRLWSIGTLPGFHFFAQINALFVKQFSLGEQPIRMLRCSWHHQTSGSFIAWIL